MMTTLQYIIYLGQFVSLIFQSEEITFLYFEAIISINDGCGSKRVAE